MRQIRGHRSTLSDAVSRAHGVRPAYRRCERPRAPDNELYDRGADLVEAAMAIRRVAGSPEASRAVPAVLGCIESALQELVTASVALEQATAEVSSSLDRGADRVVERMHRGYANLQEALADARAATAAARPLASRALGRPSPRS